MIQQILAAYDLAQTQSEVEPIKNGLINQTWRIKNSNGDFILQRINHAIFKQPDAIAANLRILADYLAEAHPDYLFIAPIKTNKNEEMTFLDGKGYFRLSPYVKNPTPSMLHKYLIRPLKQQKNLDNSPGYYHTSL